ncbi:signal recognition particle-docking protein FtsY [Pirellula staleyi DSM 6068]|uniref:Signal recognition particle receptor FtsY n=1 Tax=Pirellula staleyi (strain ATCC 27377 / DSM 6068 / ICPB 4128) TaxID=530564 RepID=D2R649_PIRSD|nr:signal recognition particle-docking protein FtsY [Pirellula staleyi]ADB19134.1 signal recognition particle-docking protein FtsY [Pirellula staleyi DSM 6068]
MGIFDLFKKQPAAEEKKPEAEQTAASSEKPAEPAQPVGIFARLKSALKKTTDLLNTDIRDLFKKEGRLVDDEMLDSLYSILVKTDMGVGPAGRIRDRVKTDFRGRVVHLTDVIASVKSELRELVAQPLQPITYAAEGPTVVLVVGVNGSGKTTSIAKLTSYFRQQGKSVVLGAGDTFRAAACEQLTIWAERLGANIVKGEAGGDPAAVAHRAVATAIAEKADVCIIDTAGRLQTQTNLMQQLEKIHRVIGKQIPEAPHEVILVLDATAGQNAISQAQGFSTAAHCTGIVLAKLDGSAKGGVVIPIREKFSIPVKFVGLGEKATDLAIFDSDQFVDALFEMDGK